MSRIDSAAPPIFPLRPRVPIEVCEGIISFATVEASETLAACCLVCRDWVPRARRLLYREVHLAVNEPYANGRGSVLHRFYHCLKHTPSNGHLVQWLRVSDRNRKSPVDSGISFIALSFPHLLPNLMHIYFVGPNLVNIHPKFYASLSLFRNVHTLVLDNPQVSTHDQLFRFIAAFRKLTTLHLEIPTFGGDLPAGIRRSRKLAIPHLKLWYPTIALSTPISWFSPCATSSLTVFLQNDANEDVGKRDIRDVQDYMQRCGKSLCHLKLEWDTSCKKIGKFDLSHNTNLRTLQLVDIPLYTYSARPDGAPYAVDQDKLAKGLHYVVRLLATVSSKCLEGLHIEFLSDDLPDDHYPNMLAYEWSALDSLFALPTVRHLKRIHVGIRVGHRKAVSGPAVARLLPQLASRPGANFAPSDDVPTIVDPDTLALSLNFQIDNYRDMKKPADYIQRCRGMLHELTLNWTVVYDGLRGRGARLRRDLGSIPQRQFDFSHNMNLRTLRLVNLPINRENEIPFKAAGDDRLIEQLHRVVHLLTTMPSVCLEDLDLELYSYPPVCAADTTDYDWSTLDSLLTLPKFSHLKRIRVGFSIGHPTGRVVVSGGDVAHLLPQLASRPSADFTPMELSDDGASAIIDIDALSSDVFDCGIGGDTYEQDVAGFTQRCGDSLRALRLKWKDKDVSGCLLDLSHNTNLRILHFEGRDEEHTWSPVMSSTIHDAVHILTTVSSQFLEDLEVRFVRSSFEEISTISRSGWDVLDSALASPIFSNLKRIHIGYAGSFWGPSGFLEWEISGATLARLLPQLASRPAADFTPFHSQSRITDPEVLAPQWSSSRAVIPRPRPTA